MLICLQQLWETLTDVFLLDSWQQSQRKEGFQSPFFPKKKLCRLKACNQQELIVHFDGFISVICHWWKIAYFWVKLYAPFGYHIDMFLQNRMWRLRPVNTNMNVQLKNSVIVQNVAIKNHIQRQIHNDTCINFRWFKLKCVALRHILISR